MTATAEQVSALRALSRPEIRGEADRARLILLTLAWWSSVEVSEAFGVTADAVRHWRNGFMTGA